MSAPSPMPFAAPSAHRIAIVNPTPYPPSPVLALDWIGPATRREDLDGDDWPVTWGADGHQYTAYGDGWGVRPIVKETKANTGFVRLVGPASDFGGEEVTIPWFGAGAQNPNFKGCGLLAAGRTLYHFLRYQGPLNPTTGKRPQIASTLIWSHDLGRTWENAAEYVPDARPSNLFFDEPDYAFHTPNFLQAGCDYADAPDSYAYLYSPRENRRRANDSLDLARVLLGSIPDRAAYEFFAGVDGSDRPRWTRDAGARHPIVRVAGCVNAGDAVYLPALRRYLLVTCGGDFAPGERTGVPSNLLFLDAPHPWGPWTVAGCVPQWGTGEGGDLRYDPRLPAAWLTLDCSADSAAADRSGAPVRSSRSDVPAGFTAHLIYSDRAPADKLNHQPLHFRRL